MKMYLRHNTIQEVEKTYALTDGTYTGGRCTRNIDWLYETFPSKSLLANSATFSTSVVFFRAKTEQHFSLPVC